LSFDELLDDHDHDHQAPGHHHLHDAYDSVTFTSTTDLDPRKLIALLEDPPVGLFRAKGFATFATPDDQRKFLLHMVGHHVVFEPAPWSRGEPRETQLVFIGSGLDPAATLTRLRDTVHTSPATLDEQTLLGVWRYVPRELSDAEL
ncbi:GTP-binding protein, partial [Nocardia alni]|uniref:GTP-binding protein n=1 Tax=Nocardia alni TaxID=2815723 RepID=UPI001C24A920